MATEETWEDRYKRAVLNHFQAPADVDLSTVEISVIGEDGYAYSEYTMADPDIQVSVTWQYDGKPQYAGADGPEAVAELLASFLTPTESA